MNETFALIAACVALAFAMGFSLGYALFSWDGGDNDDDIHGNSGGLSHA